MLFFLCFVFGQHGNTPDSCVTGESDSIVDSSLLTLLKIHHQSPDASWTNKHHLCLFKHISLNLSTVRLCICETGHEFSMMLSEWWYPPQEKRKNTPGNRKWSTSISHLKDFLSWTLHRLSVKLLSLEQLLSWITSYKKKMCIKKKVKIFFFFRQMI